MLGSVIIISINGRMFMDSFIIKLENFFRMVRDDGSVLDPRRSSYIIPKYQREYTWNNDMIEELINDIEDRDKFLGIVILDTADDHFEIIDGQQRITTCYMILMALYNVYSGSPREQERIRNLIQPAGNSILVNNSIGQFFTITDDKIDITIPDDDSIDIYCQKHSFLRAFECIKQAVKRFESNERIRNFYRKLKDCTFLVLLNDNHGSTKPVEQIFLDINEKSQLLDPADIFKGHCFENFDDEYSEDLKELWIELKRCSISFQELKVKDLSEYIYNYLLITESNKITEKLKLNGKHYLHNHNMDDTERLLKRMIAYGQSIKKLYDNVVRNDYHFEDLCPDAANYRETADNIVLKDMFKDILCLDAQYAKLPVMYFVYILSSNSAINREVDYDTFKRIVTNLYVYTVLFSISPNKKSKQIIDYSIRDALNSDENVSRSTLNCAKELRINSVNEFTMPPKCNKYEVLSPIYSIMDNYTSAFNWLNEKYKRENRVNLEHLIMADNKDCIIEWIREDENRTIFPIPVNQKLANQYKKNTVNYLLLDEDLNQSMHNYDIVEKLKRIKQWYHAESDDSHMPKHIRVILTYIEKMDLYKELVEMKRRDEPDEEIFGRKYFEFLADYFSEEKQHQLLILLKNEFSRSFQN